MQLGKEGRTEPAPALSMHLPGSAQPGRHCRVDSPFIHTVRDTDILGLTARVRVTDHLPPTAAYCQNCAIVPLWCLAAPCQPCSGPPILLKVATGPAACRQEQGQAQPRSSSGSLLALPATSTQREEEPPDMEHWRLKICPLLAAPARYLRKGTGRSPKGLCLASSRQEPARSVSCSL